MIFICVKNRRQLRYWISRTYSLATVLITPENSSLVVTLVYHYDHLVNYVRHHFGDWHFAQDVVHDVCMELIERPPQQEVHTPLAFLQHLLKHRAIDRCRSQQVQQRHIADMQATASTFSTHDGAHILHFKQKLAALITIIEQLPARQRQVFLLHRLHQMPQQEIADELGISRNMVTQHFGKAMSAIQRAWEESL
jgi:RNA polymerase sigma factor (sigma-70 family)